MGKHKVESIDFKSFVKTAVIWYCVHSMDSNEGNSVHSMKLYYVHYYHCGRAYVWFRSKCCGQWMD